MTNYLSSSMYMFLFIIGPPIVLSSSKVICWSATTFVVSFFASIIGPKIFLSFILTIHFGFLQGIWFRHNMQLLGLFLMIFALLFVKDGFTYLRAF